MNRHTINRLAFRMATEILHVVEDCLLRSEHRAAHREFYEICRSGLERLESRHKQPCERVRKDKAKVKS